MMITKILNILPEQYKHFSSAWDSVNPDDKTLENLISRLTLEEAKIGSSSTSNNEVAFKAIKKENRERQCFNCKSYGHVQRDCRKKNRQCGICKKTNHSEKDCFFRNKDGNSTQCTICKRTNHTEENCFLKNRGEKSEKKVSFLTDISKTQKKEDNNFVVDSGSTCHLTNNINMLTNFRKCFQSIEVAKKNQNMTALGIGDIESEKCNVKDVLFVPDVSKNLFSVKAITENNGEVSFSKDKVEIKNMKNGETVLIGSKSENGLFMVNLNSEKEVLLTENEKDTVEWHRKLGHISVRNIKKLCGLCEGLPDFLTKTKNVMCSICIEAKQVKKPFNTERERATRPLQLIHTDLCGPIDPATYDNKRYFLTFLDDYTHFVHVYLLKHKSEVEVHVKQYVNEVEAKFNLKVHKLRSDNGGEYSRSL